MALDGTLLRQIRHELESCLIGARIDKIHQFSREEMIFVLRLPQPTEDGSRTVKLYLSAGADSPRIHLTSASFENPKSPPMFCMLMRKYLGSAKLVEIRQIGLDRILHLVFETRNEMGDLIQLTVAIEIMGRHSNIILIDETGRVIDSIKRIDDTMSSVRPILPGVRYTLPPAQDKLDLIDVTPEQIEQRLRSGKDTPLSKALLSAVQGVSPIVCREIANYVFLGDDCVISEMTENHFDRLRFFLTKVIDYAKNYTGTPTSVIDSRKKPVDFSFMDIHQYGGSMFTRTYDTYSQLLDDFYTQRDNIQRMRHRSADLLKVLANTADRIARKLSLQQKELADCSDRETWKIYGDLINANLYSIQKGDRTATLVNFYDENQAEVTIPLDPRKTPAQNAQKYYGEYRKADTAEKKLRELIEEGQQEAIYIDSVFDALTRAQTNDELSAIRAELAEQGYLRKKGPAPKKGKEAKLAPKRYRSDDGFLILVGRNNIQNDQLTLKDARGRDVWFHTKNIPGSHTIVVSDGQEVPDSTLNQAAIIAAANSKAADSAQVPVDYTLIKNVKKPRGAKPGMVIYVNYQTAYVTPDFELEKRLMID